ncbi:MAG: metallophosphoesterase, partial [Oscillospiraceae bacterium]|nr:metallophosphoesterase [Oscillospiraceae bacterium]
IPWSENDVAIPGNHDFCYLPGNIGLGDAARCEEFSEKWAPCYKQNIYFDSKIINGVNFVSLFNIYYRISDEQVRLLRDEVNRGYPVVLCMHVPLFCAENVDARLKRGHPEGGMLAPPEEFLARYAPRYAEEQGADADTLRAVRYIANEPRIAAVIAGHQHENFDGFADCGKRQVLTASVGREGVARLIEII